MLDISAATALVKRIIPRHADQVDVAPLALDAHRDTFSIESTDGRIILSATTPACIGAALYHYLTQICQAQISWNGTNLSLPDKLPSVPAAIVQSTPYNYRYYLNYCTFSYTTPWWDWARWEREIDWMALHGINMPLSVLGQNSVWRRTYHKLGLNDNDLQDFFSGPAYVGFNWMGVLDGWGGPFSDALMHTQEGLQKKILRRLRELGMIPVLPAFTGHVPAAFKRKFPTSHMQEVSWEGFAPTYLLDPDHPMFAMVGEVFLREQMQTYGTDHHYSADAFIEMIPPSNDAGYLRQLGASTYNAMARADPQAVWVMQGWMFQYLSKFWGNDQIRALLSGVPDDKMLILDLYSEVRPVWQQTEGYFGKQWAWCMLHNFGGNSVMYGHMEQVANGPAEALANPAGSSIRGIGMTMEALEQNPVMYELMAETIWRDKPVDLDKWLPHYVRCRYGKENDDADAAWEILRDTVYNAPPVPGMPDSIINRRPAVTDLTAPARSVPHYDPLRLLKAWNHLLETATDLGSSDGYRYDLVDVARQVMANYAQVVYRRYAAAVNEKQLDQQRARSREFLEILTDMDRLVGTQKDFLLGAWLEDAKRMGTNDSEKRQYEQNARNIITTWGDKDSQLHDYVKRQWNGLLVGFYRPRWEQFFNYVETRKSAEQPLDADQFSEQIKAWEWDWVNSTDTFPSKPQGDSIEISLELHGKYAPLIEDKTGSNAVVAPDR